MVGREKISDRRLRKQALVLESELNRMTLREECQNLQAATAGLGGRVKAGRWWLLLAPVAGLLATRLLRRSESTLGRGLSILKWLPPLYDLWKRFDGDRKRSESQAPTAG